MDNLKPFTKIMEQGLTGWAFSMAILEDYCEVVSKIEGVGPETIKERISKNATGKFEKARPNQS